AAGQGHAGQGQAHQGQRGRLGHLIALAHAHIVQGKEVGVGVAAAGAKAIADPAHGVAACGQAAAQRDVLGRAGGGGGGRQVGSQIGPAAAAVDLHRVLVAGPGVAEVVVVVVGEGQGQVIQ
ncbi:Uncharacterized protein APZ42_002694, partial [Daphnia magna]